MAGKAQVEGSAGATEALATEPAPASGEHKAAVLAAGNLALANELRAGGPEPRLQAQIQSRSGVRARDYSRYVEAPRNEAQRRFVAALPAVTRFINGALQHAGLHLQVSEAELATNFLSEGGLLELDEDHRDHIDGFGAAGIDTFVQRLDQLAPFCPGALLAFARDAKNHVTHGNERGRNVTSLKNLTIEQAFEANATMYAHALSELAADLAQLRPPVDVATLPGRARVFWTVVYFNAGPEVGKRRLDQHGVRWYEQRWSGNEDSSSAQFNSLLREGNWEMMESALARR